jgi:hypothetical protein
MIMQPFGGVDVSPYHALKGAARVMSKNDADSPGFVFTPMFRRCATEAMLSKDDARCILDPARPLKKCQVVVTQITPKYLRCPDRIALFLGPVAPTQAEILHPAWRPSRARPAPFVSRPGLVPP